MRVDNTHRYSLVVTHTGGMHSSAEHMANCRPIIIIRYHQTKQDYFTLSQPSFRISIIGLLVSH